MINSAYFSDKNITGIIVALPEEISTLTSRKMFKGEIIKLNSTILIAYFGAGEKNATLAAQALIKNGVNQLISWGCAAGLDEILKAGDLVLANEVIGQNNTSFSVCKSLLQNVKNIIESHNPFFKIYYDNLVASKTLVATVTDKKSLHKKTQAIAVDMESYAIANIATQNNIPFLIVRTISDTAEMDLPKAISFSLNEQGDVVLKKLLLYVLRNPSEIPDLIRLGIGFHKAKKTLIWLATYMF